jgi:hypothetical protein
MKLKVAYLHSVLKMRLNLENLNEYKGYNINS